MIFVDCKKFKEVLILFFLKCLEVSKQVYYIIFRISLSVFMLVIKSGKGIFVLLVEF